MKLILMKMQRTCNFLQLVLILALVLGLASPRALFSQNSGTRNLLITFKKNVTADEKQVIKDLLSANSSNSPDSIEYETWRVSKEINISNQVYKSGEAIIEYLKRSPGVLTVEEDHSYAIQDSPNDPLISQQWGLDNQGQGGGLLGADIEMFHAWNVHTGGEQIIAGIIDSGIDYRHEDLVENIWQNLEEDADGDGHTLELVNGQWELDPGDLDGLDNDQNGYPDDLIGWDFINNDNNPFDDNGHGTHVAGIISAKGNNGKGIAGINWSGKLMALKAFDDMGNGSLSHLLPALKYARKMGAHFTNNSWGGTSYSNLMFNEIRAAGHKGQLLIAAAGNSGGNNLENPIYPASYELDNIIAVAATDRRDQLASFSNFSPTTVDLAAPGQDILSTLPGNSYGLKSGTSMAAPFVSGAVSLIWSYSLWMDHQQIKNVVLSSVKTLPSLVGKNKSNGRLNMLTAMQTSTEICTDWLNYSQNFKVKALAESGSFLWAATDEGLVRLNKEDCSSKIYTKKNSGLHDNDLVTIAIDHDGVIWVGSEEDGVFSFDGSNWRTYVEDNSALPEDDILSILVDSLNRKWIGTKDDGIAIFDNNTWQTFDKKNTDLPSDKIQDMKLDQFGNIWICTSKGLVKYDNSSWSVLDKKNSALPDNNTYGISIDENGVQWIATKKGVARYDGNSWQVFNKKNSGLPEDRVYSIGVEKNGNVWMGTRKGVSRYKNSTWTNYKKSNSVLPGDEVESLLVDNINNVWVGTDKGVHVFSIDVIASFSGPNSPCIDQEIVFANTSVRGLSYTWEIDGNEVSNTRDLTYKFSEPGTYEIKLKAENNISEDVFIQEVQVAPYPSLDLGPDIEICADAFLLDACREDLIYEWFDGQGHEVGNERIYSVQNTDYYVVTGEDACGNIVQNTIHVTLNSGCMKPGDSNADGKVNIIDFLVLGQADEITGPARDTLDQDSTTHPAEDWATHFSQDNPLAPGINHKHADANGDGLLEIFADGNLIKQYANVPHETVINNSSTGAYLKVAHLGTNILSDDTIHILFDIAIKNQNDSVPDIEDVYGIAFSIDSNFPLSQPPVLSTQNSWLGNVNQLIIEQYRPEQTAACQGAPYTQIDVGLTLEGGRGATGNGSIGTLGIIIVIDDLAEDDLLQDFSSFSMTLKNPIAINSSGEYILSDNGVSQLTSIVPIKIPQQDILEAEGLFSVESDRDNYPIANWQDFNVYPNPANQQVNLAFSLNKEEQLTMSIRNTMGVMVYSIKQNLEIGKYQQNINLDHLPAGVYLIEITNGEENQIKKLIKTN